MSGARHRDGSAGDVDYGAAGGVYARYRQPEPAIARLIDAALGDARSVINVGAGAGSYEPADRSVTAVEPSAAMRAQRPPELPAAVDAVAEALPFGDGSFDAAMATVTVHQWRDLARGLAELRRVARGPVVILTADPAVMNRFWLTDYVPEVTEAEARRFPPIATIVELLGGAEVAAVPIPFDCRDGFNEAYYGRPEGLLDRDARLACSSWTFVSPAATMRFEADLRRDLDDGTWDRHHGHLRRQPVFDGSLRLVVGR